jgi:PAS domain S-box-containing protein
MTSDLVMAGSYNYGLVALSILIAMLGSYATIDLAGRVKASHGGSRLSWRIGGATAMAIGTWAMHYTGMLAFSLPVPIRYDWPTALLSFLPSLLASAVALVVVIRPKMESSRAFVASFFIGGGIAALHYTAMASMRFQGMHRYSPALVTVSVLLAMLFALLSVWLTFLFRDEPRDWKLRKLASVALMGTAIWAMHYTGMATASFVESATAPDLSHAVMISSLGAAGIGAVALTVLAVALVTSTVDRLQKGRVLLDELFEQAPEAVVLMNEDQSIVRVNKGFTQLFGYSPKEAIGRYLHQMIVPDDLQDEVQKFNDLLASGQRVETEAVRRRKDGSLLHVSILQVPVRLPGEGIVVYAIYRDITERNRVEQRLREYEKAVEGLDEMIVVVDRDYRYVVANRAFLKYRGLELQQFVGRKIPDVMNPGVFENIAKPKLDECFEGHIVKYEMRYHYPTLGERDLLVSYFPIEGPRGVDRVACILQDITEAKRAEEALRSSETKLRRLLDSSIVGVVFWDLQGNLLGANDLFLNMIGYSRLDLEQGRLSWKDITPPEYAAVDERAIAELLATGNCTPFEKEYVRKDGSRVSVMIGSAMLEGQKDQGSSFIMDITERKRVEEQLRQSEERFRQMAESITEVFWMTNPDKRQILYVSPGYENIWGRSRESVYERATAWIDAIHPDDRDRVEKSAMTQQIMGRYDEEYRIIRPDGRVRWIRDRAFPIKDKSGRVYRVTGIAEDITERKLAEEKLRATTEQLRALSARVQSAREEEATRIAREIHDELGAALTCLRWDLDDINELASETGSQLDLQERRKKTVSMMSLIDTTINTVRRIASELRPIGLDDLGLIAAIEMQARQFQERTGISIQCTCALEKVELSRDKSTTAFRIFQEALTNILRHAEATRVNIQIKEEDGEFILTISDNGRGITDDEKSGQRTLGLLGMRERAHLVGGKIDINGLAGKGTVVTVRIPISG